MRIEEIKNTMQIKLSISHKNKTVKILTDKVNGELFAGPMLERIFALEDKGYKATCGSKALVKKFCNYRTAHWRQYS